MPIRNLEFIGDQTPPDAPARVHARRPVLGSGEQPDELVRLATHRSSYVPVAGTRKPSVRVERASGGEVWRIDVPVDEVLQGARPGRTAERVPAETILAQADPRVNAT